MHVYIKKNTHKTQKEKENEQKILYTIYIKGFFGLLLRELSK